MGDQGHVVGEGWSKNIYLGGRRSFPDEPVARSMVPILLVLAMLFWLVPPAILLLSQLTPVVGAPRAEDAEAAEDPAKKRRNRRR